MDSACSISACLHHKSIHCYIWRSRFAQQRPAQKQRAWSDSVLRSVEEIGGDMLWREEIRSSRVLIIAGEYWRCICLLWKVG